MTVSTLNTTQHVLNDISISIWKHYSYKI